MASPDRAPEDPHVISFSNEQIGVSIELTLGHSAMETLETVDRELMERLLRSQAYTFAVLMMVKKDLPDHEWRNTLIRAINDQRESVYEPENYLPRLAEFLGLDIETPPYLSEIHQLPATESA